MRCLPIAFAHVLDVPIEEITTELGHDGSEIWWPDLAEPYRRRGFHIQEMIRFCLARGVSVTPLEPIPAQVTVGSEVVIIKAVDDFEKKWMWDQEGVLTGRNGQDVPHAITWTENRMFDPGIGKTVDDFQIQCFWRIKSECK